MSEQPQVFTEAEQALRDQLITAVEHLKEVVPGQAPIREFVHHNTLHGYQHLPFHEALELSHKVSGARGYYPQEKWQEIFASGRINLKDLEQVLAADTELESDEIIATIGSFDLTRSRLYQVALQQTLFRLTPAQLTWEMEELHALEIFQADVSENARKRLLQFSGFSSEKEAIDDLWKVCLDELGLTYYSLHPEDVMEISPEQAEELLNDLLGSKADDRDKNLGIEYFLQREFQRVVTSLLDGLGRDHTLRGMLLKLTGEDIQEQIQPLLVRQMANYLDLGIASLRSENQERGFYRVWRDVAQQDLAWFFEELPQWKDYLEEMPTDPLEAVIAELQLMGLPESRWSNYLQLLAMELPGWSGMFMWRSGRKNYSPESPEQVDMMDYLAVRLTLENIYARRLCLRLWQVQPNLEVLRWYFRNHRGELLVRYELFNSNMPDFLTSLAQRLADTGETQNTDELKWTRVSQLIWTWQHRQSSIMVSGYSVCRDGWRLFRLCQHLGLSGKELTELLPDQISACLNCIESITEEKSGALWLAAYEQHYRDEILSGLAANYTRDKQDDVPEAQLVLCMDDREEGFRRQLEEENPDIRTYGAAAFFDLDLSWQGMDDKEPLKLCPVPMTPGHVIREVPVVVDAGKAENYHKKRGKRLKRQQMFYQELRRNLLVSVPGILITAPLALLSLISRVLKPREFGLQLASWQQRNEGIIDTTVDVRVQENTNDYSGLPQGYSDQEQAEIVKGLLTKIGLLRDFSPLVLFIGHGSVSENNPHYSAYGCGACSGRYSGPNGRVFAAMGNRQPVRDMLREQGIDIPQATWFLGGERNTCNDIVTLFDEHSLPEELTVSLEKLKQDIVSANLKHAQERCRKFASAAPGLTPQQSHHHVLGRSLDFSQVRPELGHATVAAAVIGRRSLTRGLFMDRRVFLVSYDPSQDPEGKTLEQTLVLTSPVGAGIALEYYFSSVDNQSYGCGSKVTHNVVGLFGVMDGASSDLRTGLPRQMIEIHEAMRLQVIVEVKPEILSAIVERQPVLQQLVGNGWINVATIDPESGEISVFELEQGFREWKPADGEVETVASSNDWCLGSREPRPPALLDLFSAQRGHHV